MFDIDRATLDKLEKARIIRKVPLEIKTSGASHVGIPEGQLWKIKEALKRKEEHPEKSWKAIAKDFPKSKTQIDEE